MNLGKWIAPPLLVLVMALASGCAGKPSSAPPPAAIGSKAADQALSMLGKPYRYGGNTPRGFDCSGLVQYSYLRAGVRLPRTTKSQRRHSRPVSLKKLRRGDLLFFNQEGKRSSHVGIYIGNQRFVHAPSSGKRVNIASLLNPYWRKHLAGARRPDVH